MKITFECPNETAHLFSQAVSASGIGHVSVVQGTGRGFQHCQVSLSEYGLTEAIRRLIEPEWRKLAGQVPMPSQTKNLE